MDIMRRFLQQKAFYFITFIVIVSITTVLLLAKGKIGCFILLNGIHAKWLDITFINLTVLRDGLFNIIIAVFLFVANFRHIAIQIVIVYLLSGITMQVLKGLFAARRPRTIKDGNEYHYFVDGINGTGWSNFPSGPTTSIFALAAVLALFVRKKSWGLLLLLVATVVGYSSICPGQHFLGDVLAGALLGTITGMLIYCFVHLPGKKFTLRDTPAAAMDKESYRSGFAGNHYL